ncbi:reverse transcriptase domain-containing protein [Tanacetum coccineum]
MLKALLSNKEKLLELANTPLNENCSAVILKKLPEKLGDPGNFLILCSFNELNCKALVDLGASINLMPLSVWKNLGLFELISTRKLANRSVCTPAGIARDVFVLVGRFTFPVNFVIVGYESDPRVPLILGIPFLRTAHALINEFSMNSLLLVISTGNDNITPEDVIREIEYFLNRDPLAENSLNNNLIYTIPRMFTDEHTLDYSSLLRYDDANDDLFYLKTNSDEWGKIFYDDPFDSKENKIKLSKLLVDELDSNGSSSFLPHFLECDSNLYEVTNQVTPDKNVKKKSSSNASLIHEDFNLPPSDHELPFHIEILRNPRCCAKRGRGGMRRVSPDTSLCGVSKAWSLSRKVGMCRDESRYMG